MPEREKQKHISFYVKDKKDIKFLDKIANNSEYFRKLISDIENGSLTYDELSLKDQMLLAKIDKIKLQSDLLKEKIKIEKCLANHVVKYFNIFQSYPTKRGLKALNYQAELTNEITSRENYLPKFNYTKTHGTWYGMCKLCTTSNFSANTERGIIEKLEKHFFDEHEGIEPYELMKN